MQPLALAKRIMIGAFVALCQIGVLQATICIKCPLDANDSAVGVGFAVFVDRGGTEERVNGQIVAAGDTLILKSAAYYSAFGMSGGVGAGFTGGTAQIILPNGTITNVTPPDMETTLVTSPVNPCTPPAGVAAVPFKPMLTAYYTFTDEDIAAGLAQFRFEYTNALSLLPNVQGQCIDRTYISLTESVLIEPNLSLTLQRGSNSVLTVRGPTHKNYRIESTDSLDSPNWTARASFRLDKNPFVWGDASPSPDHRFYRVKVVP